VEAGVEDAESSSNSLFTNLEGANVGFANWHPVAVTSQGNRLGGQGEMGGVWEWTSSVLDRHEGFEAMPLYPGYTGLFIFLQPIFFLARHLGRT
jgi:formylglycine-generating enzyme required for sulfatase activity